MNIKFNKFNRSENTLWGQRTLFWEIELVDYDFVEITTFLKSEDAIWHDNNLQGTGRSSLPLHLHLSNKNLTQLQNEFIDLKSDIIDSVYNDAEKDLKGTFYKGKEFYKKHSEMGIQIYKDYPGFHMTPHLDNYHVMLQMIINITDNETGTGLYHPIDKDTYLHLLQPYYEMTGEKNKGILFLNNIMSPHGIRGITKDRYILYSSILL